MDKVEGGAIRIGYRSKLGAGWRRRSRDRLRTGCRYCARQRRDWYQVAADGSGLLSGTAVRRGRTLAKARNAIRMQLRIIDRSALFFNPTCTIVAVRMHSRLISLAIMYVMPRRPGTGIVARVSLLAIGYHPGAVSVHLGASGWHDRDRRQEHGREGHACYHLML